MESLDGLHERRHLSIDETQPFAVADLKGAIARSDETANRNADPVQARDVGTAGDAEGEMGQ
jgi:hypothetical protein